MTDDKGAGDGPYTLKLIDNGYKTEVVYGPTFNSYCIADFTGLGLVFALNAAHAAGRKAERDRCYAIASRDVEVVDNVSGSSFMCKPNCSCAKDIIAGGINENNK